MVATASLQFPAWNATKTENAGGTRVPGACAQSSPSRRGRQEGRGGPRTEGAPSEEPVTRPPPAWMARSRQAGPWPGRTEERAQTPALPPCPAASPRKRTPRCPSPTHQAGKPRPRCTARLRLRPSSPGTLSLSRSRRMDRQLCPPRMRSLGAAKPASCSGSLVVCCSLELTNSPYACMVVRKQWRESRRGSNQLEIGLSTLTAISGKSWGLPLVARWKSCGARLDPHCHLQLTLEWVTTATPREHTRAHCSRLQAADLSPFQLL